MCRVEKTSTMNVLTAIDTLVTWDVEKYDTDNMVTLASSTSQITINTPGIYTITAGLSFQANATNRRAMWITKNSTVYNDNIVGVNRTAADAGSILMQATTIIELANADVLRLYAYQSSGSTLTVPASASAPETTNTFLSICLTGNLT
jgi:hypothetical protein